MSLSPPRFGYSPVSRFVNRLFALRWNWYFTSARPTLTQNLLINGVIMKYQYLAGALVGDRVNSLVLQGSCGPSDTIPLILKYYFCTSRSPSLPLHDLSAYCSRAGCPGPSVATVAPLQAGTTRAAGAARHKPVTQIIQRQADLVPANTGNPCSLSPLAEIRSFPFLTSIWNKFHWNSLCQFSKAFPFRTFWKINYENQKENTCCIIH
jgi:hypothetical protein